MGQIENAVHEQAIQPARERLQRLVSQVPQFQGDELGYLIGGDTVADVLLDRASEERISVVSFNRDIHDELVKKAGHYTLPVSAGVIERATGHSDIESLSFVKTVGPEGAQKNIQLINPGFLIINGIQVRAKYGETIPPVEKPLSILDDETIEELLKKAFTNQSLEHVVARGIKTAVERIPPEERYIVAELYREIEKRSRNQISLQNSI